jgi:UDP-N-acetylglucosamine/UDP-N-acetyl-alpha-D-glucosaminouronate 4-epimerase
MRYLVTGGAGFIGSNTVDEILRRGHSVVVLDDFSTGRDENLEECAGKIEIMRGSITDLPTVRKACQGADYVIHLAALASVPRSVADPIESNHINIDGTLNVLVAARDAKVRRLVYAASCSAYGEATTQPQRETMCADPISPYGVTKFVGELYAEAFQRCYGLETVCLRYFNVFGPRQDPTSEYSGVLSKFISTLLAAGQPVIFGDGEQSRDFIFIENVVQANLLACEAQNCAGRTFNIGTGGRHTLNETLRLLEKISAKKTAAKYEPPRSGDILHSQADITEARKALGYDPKIGFGEGLRRTWDWYYSNQSK